MDQAAEDHRQLHAPPCPRRGSCRCLLFSIIVKRDDLGPLKLKARHPPLGTPTATTGSTAKGEDARD
ncbi:hypothetical protein QYE76_039741 [Lolium multiflorum]|uniref:Uncharacterized protein n=1 Tax=Lolium multiflorum TaxID=4521 RepID=A0AAD8TBY9_LOLMU|nr:hypothetical protein QYE76_039741 [Lolium multiflorum]